MTTLNLSWLEDFLALAASGHFSRAADERHMTQPAFSRRIRALETWLGAELFDRRNQPATLTDTGQWFNGIATDMLAKAAKIPGEARAFNEANANTLRIAATHALSFTFIGFVLAKSGIIEQQVNILNSILGRLRGGAGYVSTLASAGFGILALCRTFAA